MNMVLWHGNGTSPGQVAPSASAGSINTISKLLLADATRFSGECDEEFKVVAAADASVNGERVSRTSPAPGDLLGLDHQLRVTVEKSHANPDRLNSWNTMVLDRESLGDEFFGLNSDIK